MKSDAGMWIPAKPVLLHREQLHRFASGWRGSRARDTRYLRLPQWQLPVYDFGTPDDVAIIVCENCDGYLGESKYIFLCSGIESGLAVNTRAIRC